VNVAATDVNPVALSVVVPVLNGKDFIAGTLQQLVSYLGRWPGGAEIIVVDDGSSDGTAAIVRATTAEAAVPVRVECHERNLGKGAAISRGMQLARGTHCVFLDADLAYPPDQIAQVCAALTAGADLAIACRVHPRSRFLVDPSVFRYAFLRHEGSRLLNWFVRLFLLPCIDDSQAGLKGFSARAAARLFTGWLPRGFSFDLALLFRAQRLGLRIEQVPVLYRSFSEPSSVRIARDAARALRDVVQIRARLISGRFERWGTVFRNWWRRIGGVARTLQWLMLNPGVLVALFGLSALALVVARLVLMNGRVALAGWVGVVLATLFAARRADLRRGRSAGQRAFLFGSKTEAALVLVIVAAAATLRLAALDRIPPMIHGDSAECGLVGLRLLHGEAADLFDFSPWYATPFLSFVPYALSFWINAITVVGLRLPSALLGIASVVALYFLVRSDFGIRAALLAAACAALSHTAIHFSRIGLWNIQVAFYAVTALALVSRGLRRRSMQSMALAGFVSGLALYSYTAGRLIPLIAGLLLSIQLLRRQRGVARGLAFYAAALLVTASPLVLNYVRDPSILELDRSGTVWVFAQENWAHVTGTLGSTSVPMILWEQVRRTLAGFVTMGDASGQYATEQPILSPLSALFFIAGVIALARGWREPRCQLLLLWLTLGLVLGSVFIIDPPSHTRLIAVLPATFIAVGVGVDRALSLLEQRVGLHPTTALALCLLVVAQVAAFNLTGYYRFSKQMALQSSEWDVLKVMERTGAQSDYYLYTGALMLADAPVFRLFSAKTRAVNGFSEMDLPRWLGRDTTFIVTPEFRKVGVAISEHFPGVEREVIDQEGIRQLIVYRCTTDNGCRRMRS
jgi:dolichyl-phosphate beta-glucosyltransferase